MADKAPLIVVLGPTGSGKSDLALEIAQRFGGEIVNCDSVQLYRYLDIGSAKTSPRDRRGIPHHLIDLLDPDEHFTAGDYSAAARPVLHEIAARGRVPVVAGGTGFYLRALLEGLPEGPPRDSGVRERLSRRTPASLHRILTRLDPGSAERIHANDAQKVIRALEICMLTRMRLGDLREQYPARALEEFDVIKLGLDPDRKELVSRIDLRCQRMFEAGLIEETRSVIARGYSAGSKALQSIGYREAVLHIQGAVSADEALIKTQAATRQYAKRQRTWFRDESVALRLNDFGWSRAALTAAVRHLSSILKQSFA